LAMMGVGHATHFAPRLRLTTTAGASIVADRVRYLPDTDGGCFSGDKEGIGKVEKEGKKGDQPRVLVVVVGPLGPNQRTRVMGRFPRFARIGSLLSAHHDRRRRGWGN